MSNRRNVCGVSSPLLKGLPQFHALKEAEQVSRLQDGTAGQPSIIAQLNGGTGESLERTPSKRPMTTLSARVWVALLSTLADAVEDTEISSASHNDGMHLEWSKQVAKGRVEVLVDAPDEEYFHATDVFDLTKMAAGSALFSLEDLGRRIVVQVMMSALPTLICDESQARAAAALDGEGVL